jgi:hypothetical protein
MGVFGNLLKQINAKVRLDLYRLKIPVANSMVVGVDVVNEGRKSIIGFTASHNKFFSQYFSRIAHQEMHKDIIKTKGKDAQEDLVT